MTVLPLPQPVDPEVESRLPEIPPGPGRSLLPGLGALLDPRRPYLVPLLLVVVSRGLLALLLPHATEDAYITYRYARNFASGLGPVFNPGERVLGFTSPLWMAWNALGWLLVHEPVGWSRFWALVADAATVVCGAALLERHFSRASAWCFAFAVAAWISYSGVAVSGMENALVPALILGSALLVEGGGRGAGVALGALALCRPEGVLAAILVGLRAPRREQVVGLAIAGVGALALTAYFGSPVPQSMLAKAQLYGTPGPWAGRHWWEWAFPFALARWPSVPDGSFLFLGTVLFAPAAWEGARALWRIRNTALAHAVAACAAIWAGYALTGAAYFFWYLTVPLTAWFALVAIGLPRIARGTAIYVSAALLVLGCWTVVWELYAARARAEASFAAAADFLARNAAPTDRVLLEPIGLVGWRSGLRVIDEVGLVSPRVAARRRKGPGWMRDVVETERPEWLVTRRGVLTRLEAFAGVGAPFRDAADRDTMLNAYRTATVVEPGDGDAAIVVLRRLDPGLPVKR